MSPLNWKSARYGNFFHTSAWFKASRFSDFGNTCELIYVHARCGNFGKKYTSLFKFCEKCLIWELLLED